jgi:hypothetical protein
MPRSLESHQTSSSGTVPRHVGIIRIGQAFRTSTAPHMRTLRLSRALRRGELVPQQVRQSAVTKRPAGGSSSFAPPQD